MQQKKGGCKKQPGWSKLSRMQPGREQPCLRGGGSGPVARRRLSCPPSPPPPPHALTFTVSSEPWDKARFCHRPLELKDLRTLVGAWLKKKKIRSRPSRNSNLLPQSMQLLSQLKPLVQDSNNPDILASHKTEQKPTNLRAPSLYGPDKLRPSR